MWSPCLPAGSPGLSLCREAVLLLVDMSSEPSITDLRLGVSGRRCMNMKPPVIVAASLTKHQHIPFHVDVSCLLGEKYLVCVETPNVISC